MLRRILPFLVILCGLLWNRTAHASHFRYGTISWTVPNPAQPLNVLFTVDVAWRSNYLPVDSTNLDFGDGNLNGLVVGNQIGSGTDATGQSYTVYEYQAMHTYAAATTYTAQFTNCCRLGGLVNGGGNTTP